MIKTIVSYLIFILEYIENKLSGIIDILMLLENRSKNPSEISQKKFQRVEVKVIEDFTEDQKDLLWNLYFESFYSFSNQTAQDQICFTKKTFNEYLESKDVIKYVLFVDGMIKGISLLTNNFDKAKITYCNPLYFQNKYPNWFDKGKIYYVIVIFIAKGFTKRKFATPFLQKIIEFIDDHKHMVAFDYAGKNRSLPFIIKLAGKQIGVPIQGGVLDKQYFSNLYHETSTPD